MLFMVDFRCSSNVNVLDVWCLCLCRCIALSAFDLNQWSTCSRVHCLWTASHTVGRTNENRLLGGVLAIFVARFAGSGGPLECDAT